MTFIKEIDPNINHILPIVDQTRATPAINNFNKKKVIPIFLRINAPKAASTIGKIQYPSTQTH